MVAIMTNERGMTFSKVKEYDNKNPSHLPMDYISDCGEYKIVKYSDGIRFFSAYVKGTFSHKNGKTYQAFGNNVDVDQFGKTVRHKTFESARQACIKHKADA